jgi:hypothetical protein
MRLLRRWWEGLKVEKSEKNRIEKVPNEVNQFMNAAGLKSQYRSRR